jgi:hypothetical protein
MIGRAILRAFREGWEQKPSLEWIVERGRLGSAFPPFARNAKDGAPDHLWQGKK